MDDDLYLRFIDDGDFEIDPPESVRCKYCKEDDLYWVQTQPDHKWRLMTYKGIVHSCREYKK